MTLEMIIGGVVALLGVLAAAFGIGHSTGKTKAEAAAQERETQIKIDAEQQVAKRQTTVTKEASDVKDTVTRMSDSTVDQRLHDKWRAPTE